MNLRRFWRDLPLLTLCCLLLLALTCQAEEKITVREEIVIPDELPEQVVRTALSARILLHALAEALAHLRKEYDLSLYADQSDHEALALLLSEDEVTLTENDSTGTISAECSLRLKGSSQLRLITGTLDLLPLAKHILERTDHWLSEVDTLWQGARFYTKNEAPALSSKEQASSEALAMDTKKRSERAANALTSLFLLRKALQPGSDGWITKSQFLNKLEEASRLSPEDPWILVLLAEAQLSSHLPQESVETSSRALNLAPDLYRARYVRALAHWQLQQLGLAENDLSVVMESTEEENSTALLPILRARGAVRMLLGRFEGMCQDFRRACSLGDCDGLKHARSLTHCLPEDPEKKE